MYKFMYSPDKEYPLVESNRDEEEYGREYGLHHGDYETSVYDELG